MNVNDTAAVPKPRFSRAFWVANVSELLERAAYYGVFVVVTLYLSDILGFSDIAAATVSGVYSGLLYFLPTFSGALADKMGFRKSMLLAFMLLTLGYLGLGIVPSLLQSAGLVQYGERTVFTGLLESGAKYYIVPVMLMIVIGGSFIKSVISGTVARETDEKNRARGFSIFYAMVNVGAFMGKLFVDPLRFSMGDKGMIVLNYFSAGMTLVALLLIFFFYKSEHREGQGKSLREVWQGLVRVCKRGRLVALILIVSGFWLIYAQLYATMPKYVIRLAGEGSAVGWYTLVNPLVVALSVNLITSWFKKYPALTSIMGGMVIIPFAAMIMSTGNLISHPILGLHPVVFMMIVGIVFQALGECFINPRYLEFFSLQSPKGEEGLYLGFAQLDSFVSFLLGFIISGFLLDKYLPDPKRFADRAEWEAIAANAHHIWYYFAAIAALSAVAFVVYVIVIKRLDRRKAQREEEQQQAEGLR